MQLLVQDFVKNKSFMELELQHGVEVSFSKDAKLVSFNYSQILAKDDDALACQCRGLILAKSDFSPFDVSSKDVIANTVAGNTVALAVPFFRFFNYGAGAAFVNWSDPGLKIFDKADGTLAIVWFDPTTLSWQVATRSTPRADVPLNIEDFTFRTLFEKCLSNHNLSFDVFTKHLVKHKTYMFEICSPVNRVVVQYADFKLYFLGCRDLNSLSEEDISAQDIAKHLPSAKSFSVKSTQDIIDFVNLQKPSEQEGVVVCDSIFNRVKIKSASYVIAHKLKDSITSSDRNLLSFILSDQYDDMLQYIDKYFLDKVFNLKDNVASFIKEYDLIYSSCLSELSVRKSNPQYSAFSDQKNFALIVKDKKCWEAPLFRMFAGKCSSMSEFINLNKKDGAWNNSFLDTILELI